MPTKPQIQTLKSSVDSVAIVNTIRANASYTYQERIPVATQENLKEVGQAILSYQATQNEFIDALINRIALTIITSKSYQNPLREFKRGVLEYGETVAEYWVNLAIAHQFDPAVAEREWMKREIPDVEGVFHKVNYKNFWKQTISYEQLKQAFLSNNGVTDLTGRIIDAMYSASEYDEYLIMKQLIIDAALKGNMYPVQIPAITAANAKEIVTIIKSTSNAITFMSPKYNAMGVLTAVPKRDQILLLDAKFDAVIDVEVLAEAFNMDKAEFMGRRVLIDDFGELTGVVAALVDSAWFMIFDKLFEFRQAENGQGLYWQYWLHAWKIFSYSPFADAILFTTQAVTATAVTITPATVTTTPGQTVKFTAAVTGTGYIPQAVAWTLTGNQSAGTTINNAGELTIAADETATTLTVKATSTYTTTVSGSATVTLGTTPAE